MRNIWCGKYNQCLNRVCRNGGQGFDCRGCEHEKNDEGKTLDDLRACRMLILAVLMPRTYEKLKSMEKC
ncbi:hypothetical protein C6A37_01375 [Desulfobacteraceae bacterium SEEP-SAG9]|nr:hypothetical protein C6A37_01375 [Desulfobacteraceae bacterium SEEP-SAG9]